MVGRIKEQKQFGKLLQSPQSEFIALYGRRRVGKTYLVKEFFKDKFTFWHTGLSPYDRDRSNLLKEQLQAFHNSLMNYGLRESKAPKTWLEAFRLLEDFVDADRKSGKKIIFIDELPWMDTARSHFITALESFWNGWASRRNDIMLIVCGSATSWIEDNLINNKGGLYGRLTAKIHLSPFTLVECRDYYEEVGIRMSLYDVAQSYMVLGGIPYYMGMLDKDLSLAQNINQLFFAKDAALSDEFDLLFGSLFVNPEQYKSIVRALSSKHAGLTREEISLKTGIQDGGSLTKQLKSLIASNFVEKYIPYGEGRKKDRYRLCDSFCRFWLYFLEKKQITDRNFWINNVNSPVVNTWRGYAFEQMCLYHLDQIKGALGVGGVNSTNFQWSVRGDEEKEGTQIDLIIDRADNVVNLCEMKFYNEEFRVSKEYNKRLIHRCNLLQESISKRKVVHMTLVTTEGLSNNEYENTFQSVVTLEDMVRQG